MPGHLQDYDNGLCLVQMRLCLQQAKCALKSIKVSFNPAHALLQEVDDAAIGHLSSCLLLYMMQEGCAGHCQAQTAELIYKTLSCSRLSQPHCPVIGVNFPCLP